jgi:hypothetical protein
MLTQSNTQLNTPFFPRAGHISVSRRDLHVSPDEARAAQLEALIDLYDRLACNEGCEASKALRAYDAAVDGNLPRRLVEAYWQEYESLLKTTAEFKKHRAACKAELLKLRGES